MLHSLILFSSLFVGFEALFDFHGMREETDKYQPIFLTLKKNTLVLSKVTGYLNKEFSFDDDEEDVRFFACPLRSQTAMNTMLKGSHILELHITGSTKMSDLSCKSEVVPVAKEVETTENSVKIQIGFEVYTKDQELPFKEDTTLVKLVDLTFDKNTKIPTSLSYTLSAKHLHEIINYSKEKKTPSYITSNHLYGFDLNATYKKEIQEIIFNEIKKKKYFDKSMYKLSKKPLISDDDFLLLTHKKVIYFNHNTIPMWHILRLTWGNADNFLRSVANIVGDLEIEVGTSDILMLTDEYEKLKEIRLPGGDKKSFISVPDLIWKVIRYVYRSVDKQVGILMIMHNNPHMESIKVCDDISYDNGWLIANDSWKTGLLYFCELNEKMYKQLGIQLSGNYEIFNLHNFIIESPNIGGIFELGKSIDVTKRILKNLD